MKKLMSVLLALTMLLCTACGSKNTDSDADATTPNIYTDITGIAADTTVMTVGKLEISADLFFYWVNTIAKDAEQIYQQYAMYYGVYGSMLNADGTLNWDAPYTQTMTVGDVIRAQAMEKLAFFVITESFAESNGITLTDEDREKINATIDQNLVTYRENLIQKDSAFADLTDEALEEKYFYNLGVDRDTVVRMMGVTYLRDAIVEQMLTEGSSMYITDEAYEDFAFYADHILIATVDLSTQRDLPADQIAEKKALAEEILAVLQASNDLETMFDDLADLHSEDTGRKAYPTGYVFTSGEMVAEFENAVKALKPGELSGLVKSQFGYHIILRRDLAEGLNAYPNEKAAMAEVYMTETINAIIANSSVSTSDALVGIDLDDVYRAYMDRIGQSTASTSQNVEITDK